MNFPQLSDSSAEGCKSCSISERKVSPVADNALFWRDWHAL
ncbi:hypothetical protein CSC17_0868 [Klebsiella oxytoca]|nr:hypothetical protein CSC17_0868 [Klebsiella oxytoca]